MSVLLDTHVWIWWLLGQANLPEKERNALDTWRGSSLRRFQRSAFGKRRCCIGSPRASLEASIAKKRLRY